MLPIFRSAAVSIAVILLPGMGRSSADEPLDEGDPANIIEKFDAGRDGVGHLSLPVTIQNKNYPFILATGCARVVYDSSFRPILGKPKNTERGNAGAGLVELEHYDAPDASLGKLSLKTDSDMAIYDLSRMREWSGVDLYGVIGMSFLKQHIVRIDFDKGEVLFLKSVGKNPGQAFPLSFDRGVIHVEAQIPGCNSKEKFSVDIGSESNISGTMRLETYKCLSESRVAKKLPGSEESFTTGGLINKTEFLLNDFSLGSFTHHNLVFGTSPKSGNELSLGYLSRYVVTFDFPHKVMYLQEGRFYDLPDGEDRSGIHLSRHNGRTTVCGVAVFSPAWWKGIKPRDLLLAIDGTSADQISLYSLRRLLSMEGRDVTLTLQKGDVRMESHLKPLSGHVLTIRLR